MILDIHKCFINQIGLLGDFSMYYKRNIESVLRAISDTFPVLVLTGPRQVGKTTLLQHIAEEGRGYVGLDNPTVRALAKSDPELFLQR
jgi:predicted AAA+ superfamily ATPase